MQYVFSANVSVDPAYWNNIMSSIKNAGVVTYEQDWLGENAIPLTNLYDPPAFMSTMAAGAASNGLNLQYCMELNRHYLQGTLYTNLMAMGVDRDRFSR